MRKVATSALAAMLAVGVAGQAGAQDMGTVRTAPQFDIGISAGGAWSSNWFQIGDNGFKPGVAPIFGAEATYWLSPTFGIRANGQYMPSKLPQDADVFESDRWLVNNWFYGLDLMWRPMFWSNPGFLGSMYVFLGGGGLTSNPAGDGGSVNYDGLFANGVDLPAGPTRGTVGQGEAGIGFDLFPLTSAIGIFLEGGVHGYDSPAHVSDNAQNAEDKFAFTPYAVLGLKLGFGNIIPPPPPPPPPPPAIIPPPPPPPAPVGPVMQDISVCVLQNGQLTTVTAQYNPATGDTTGVPTVTEGYAANATWFINNEPITFNNRRYVKYGLPRVLGVTEVTSAGTYQGVPVFAETGAAGSPEVIYIPVRTGCEFQPYQVEQKAGAVRG
ncbi:MAG TPA: hypothetical protein VFJ16_19795 [Longimicrobium sp.]|nr:hypothetical protein [Longimicrobium sp.]